MIDSIKHDHACHCGTATHAPHETAANGCVRLMTDAPIPNGKDEFGDRWLADGSDITDFTLRQQRGYHQHPCGCWSRFSGSASSITMDGEDGIKVIRTLCSKCQAPLTCKWPERMKCGEDDVSAEEYMARALRSERVLICCDACLKKMPDVRVEDLQQA